MIPSDTSQLESGELELMQNVLRLIIYELIFGHAFTHSSGRGYAASDRHQQCVCIVCA